MAKYRKKPLVVDAEPYKEGMEDGLTIEDYVDVENIDNLISFYGYECDEIKYPYAYGKCTELFFPYINTLEGKHYITKGDYIITGIKGERYPCKKDIFEMTYEPVE